MIARRLTALGASLVTLVLAAPTLFAPAFAQGPAAPTSAQIRQRLGYLPLHPETYALAKAEAARRAGRTAVLPARTATTVPVADPSWKGVDDPNVWPSDSYGAI